jgi:hypothetical protein
MLLKAFAVLLILSLLSACAQQAVFLSDPPGAQVFIDGRPIGTTPCNYKYSNGTGGSLEVTLQKPGYDPLRHDVEADEVDKGARNRWVAAGLLIPMGSPLFLGTFFTKKLKDTYEFVMKESNPLHTARIDNAPAPTPF